MDKIIIVKHYLGKEYEITTVDGTDRNRINTFKVDDYSNVEVANRIVKRVEKDNYNKVFIDANTINVALIDILLDKLKEVGYDYNPKTGEVVKIKTAKDNSETIDCEWKEFLNKIYIPKEEF